MNDEDFDKKNQERLNKQRDLNNFNSITQKVKPENQNQQHNVRKLNFQIKFHLYMELKFKNWKLL